MKPKHWLRRLLGAMNSSSAKWARVSPSVPRRKAPGVAPSWSLSHSIRAAVLAELRLPAVAHAIAHAELVGLALAAGRRGPVGRLLVLLEGRATARREQHE